MDKIKEIAGKEQTFKAIVEEVNLDQETNTSPFQEELDEINTRIAEIEKEIENFLDAIGKAGSKVISLLEGKIEKLQEDQKELQKRKDELAMLIADSPRKVDAQIVLDALKDFARLYDKLRPAERAEYLHRIIRDVVVTEDKQAINIYGLNDPPPPGGSKNHFEWWAVLESNQRLSA